MKISKRNQFYVNLAKDKQDFWDVACDHGQAGFYAYQTQRFNRIHFVEPVEKILLKTQKNIVSLIDLLDETKINFHFSKGEEINQIIEGNFLMAGVGGELIKLVLTKLIENEKMFAHHLILSPYTDLKKIDQLKNLEQFQRFYQLVDEKAFIENKKQRQIYIFDRISF